MGKKPASALASRSLNFSIKSPASALASSYFLSVASALNSASSYFKREASSGFVLGFPKMMRLRLASLDFSWLLLIFSKADI